MVAMETTPSILQSSWGFVLLTRITYPKLHPFLPDHIKNVTNIALQNQIPSLTILGKDVTVFE